MRVMWHSCGPTPTKSGPHEPSGTILPKYGLPPKGQERAGRHWQRVHEHLVQHPRDLEHVQADEIRVKGQGKVVWLAMAIMVHTRLWLGGGIARRRDEHLSQALVQIIRSCAL